MGELRRTARIFWVHARVSLLAELQYRTDAWARLISTIALLASSLAAVLIVYSHVDSINGWTSSDLIVVLGSFFLVGAITNGIVHLSMAELAKDIKQGTLDFRLLKPVDAQVLALVQKVDPWRMLDVLVGIGLVAWGMAHAGPDSALGTLGAVGGALAMLLAATIVIAGFWLLITCIAFWTVQGEGILWALDDMFEHLRWPITIFGPALRVALMTVFPAGLAITVPAQALTGRLGAGMTLVTILVAATFAIAARLAWRAALRRYEGASG